MPHEQRPISRRNRSFLEKFKRIITSRYFQLLNIISTTVTTLVSLATAGKVVSISASFLAFKVLFDKMLFWWASTPQLFVTTSSRVWCGLSVVVLGRGFFWLKTKAPYLYSTLELGVAIATAYLAAKKAYSTKDPTTALFAFLGGVYLAVRAYDNYSKATPPRLDWLKQLFRT